MPPSRASTAQRDEALASTSQSPASLLWGHQLKREHGYLLERMKKVEQGHGAFDTRIKSVEAAADAMRDMIEHVNRLTEEEGRLERATGPRFTSAEERLGRLEEVVNKFQSLEPRLSELEAQFDVNDGIVRQMLSDHRSILQKIRAFDAELQTKRVELERLTKVNEAGNVRDLLLRINCLEQRQDEEQKQTTAMRERIQELEKSCREYDSRNAKLQAQLDSISQQQERFRSCTQVPTQIVDADGASTLPPATLSSMGTAAHALPAWMTFESQMPLPLSTEIPTQVLPSSIPDAQVQVQATSSLEASQVQASALLREESPLANVQMRRMIRAEQPVTPVALPQQPHVPRIDPRGETPASTQTQDLDAPYVRPHVPNSGRRRNPLPVYEPPLTRLQVKSQLRRIEKVADRRPVKLVILKMPRTNVQDPPLSSNFPAQPENQSNKAVQGSSEGQVDARNQPAGKKRNTKSAKPNSSRRKRTTAQKKPKASKRDMEQLELLKSFLET